MPNAALSDLRVLDVTGPMGQYCAKLLADLGADVIRVEPPEGSSARRQLPFFHDEPDVDRSLSFFFFNANKRSVTCNLESADGRALFRRLVAATGIVVSDHPAGWLEARGLSYEELVQVRPDLIMARITGFGEWGPHAHYEASDIVGAAMSGVMWLAGYPGHPPVRIAGDQGYFCSALQAAQGLLLAVHHRDRTGEGQLVEVSMQEALSMAQETAMQFWDIQGVLRTRPGDRRGLPGISPYLPANGTYECQDGYIFSMVGVRSREGWNELLAWMAEAGMVADLMEPPYQAALDAITVDLHTLLAQPEQLDAIMPALEHVDAVVSAFYRGKTKAALYEEGQARRLMLAPVNTPQDLAASPQLVERGWYVAVPHPELGAELLYPGGPYRLSETPWQIRRRAPLLGEHTVEIFHGELGVARDDLVRLKTAGAI